MAEIIEVIARLQNGSLLICEGLDGHDGCGGQGYTDGGATCCAFCLGTGLATPELASAVRDEKKFRNFTVEFIGLVDDIWEDDDVDLPALRGLADTARARLRSLFDEPESTRKAAALSTAPAARPGDEVDWKPGEHGYVRESKPVDTDEQAVEVAVARDGRIDLIVHRAADSGNFDDMTARLSSKDARRVASAIFSALAAAPAADGGRA